MGIIRLINGFINSRLRVLTFERFGDLVKMTRGVLEAPLEPTPRHTSHLLRLLPSRSGRVHKLSLRGDPRVTIDFWIIKYKAYVSERGDYPLTYWLDQAFILISSQSST
jgi:hypothetical protein